MALLDYSTFTYSTNLKVLCFNFTIEFLNQSSLKTGFIIHYSLTFLWVLQMPSVSEMHFCSLEFLCEVIGYIYAIIEKYNFSMFIILYSINNYCITTVSNLPNYYTLIFIAINSLAAFTFRSIILSKVRNLFQLVHFHWYWCNPIV